MLKNLLITILVMAAITTALFFLQIDTSESGPIEIAENIVLLAALLTWSILFYRLWREPSVGSFHAIFAAFFAILIYVVLGREVSWLNVLGVEKAISKVIELTSIIIVLGLECIILYVWVRKVKHRKQTLITFVTSHTFFYALAALFFILLGDVFEKDFFPIPQHQLFEEMSELTGQILILGSAFSEWARVIRKSRSFQS